MTGKGMLGPSGVTGNVFFLDLGGNYMSCTFLVFYIFLTCAGFCKKKI